MLTDRTNAVREIPQPKSYDSIKMIERQPPLTDIGSGLKMFFLQIFQHKTGQTLAIPLFLTVFEPSDTL
jgi:hypothetical protein